MKDNIFMGVIIVLIFLILAAFLSAMMASSITKDCRAMGKFRWEGKIYACSLIGEYKE